MVDEPDAASRSLDQLGKRLEQDYAHYSQSVSVASELIGGYEVRVHSDELVPYVVPEFTLEQVREMSSLTRAATRIGVDTYAHGSFIAAADTDGDRSHRTNYDAVWMRDTLWGYLALRADPSRAEDADRVLLTQLDYLASQRATLVRVAADPQLVNRPGHAGESDAVHIRFDPQSHRFADVMVDGESQPWAHKQNDALGLLLDTACSALLNGELSLDLDDSARLECLALLVRYFEAIGFHDMEDSGSWEEVPRRNASSIGLVVSGLERALLLASEHRAFGEYLHSLVPERNIKQMIADGYEVVRASLAAGGESPLYDAADPRYRTADAALLNLVYPAKLAELSLADKMRVVEIVDTLVREYGVIRYADDDYQSANFWFNEIRTDTSSDSHAKRRLAYIPGSEAEWFFDSWLGLAHLTLLNETGSGIHLAMAAKHTGRALGQITPRESPVLLAGDGAVAPPFCLPESYNHLRIDGRDYVVPSPIAPLNWSKATMSLLLHTYSEVLSERRSR